MSRHQRILQIYGLYIYFMSIGTDGQPPFTDGKSNLPSVPMDKVFEGTSCLGITLRHQRILKIYRWYIHFSIGTDGQPPFTDGQGFRGYLVPWYNVKAPKDITDCIFISCPSVRTDNLHLPTVNPIYRRYRWTRFSRVPRALG